MRTRAHRWLCSAALTICWAGIAIAQSSDLPRLELGAGAAGTALPAYPGSDEMRYYGVPYPHIIYRGDVVEIDKEGVRGNFWWFDGVRLEGSGSFALPVDSRHTKARRGMPWLPALAEAGPQLRWYLTNTKATRLSLDLAWRTAWAATSLDRSFQGSTLAPTLAYYHGDKFSGVGYRNLNIMMGLLFNTQQRMNYYYEVKPEYATTDRPAHSTSAGYAGTFLHIGWDTRAGDWWIGCFAKAQTFKGSSITQSPLVKNDSYFTLGLALAKVMYSWGTAATHEHPENQPPIE